MATKDNLLEIGRLSKPHGLKGEIEVVLTTNLIEERTQAGSLFYVGGDQLLVESARPKGKRWLFKFAGFDSRESLEIFRDQLLFAEPLDAFMTHDLIGLSLVDQEGINHGEVVAIQANPASDLLVLANGGLVPMNFFVEVKDGVAQVDIPVGLLDD